MYNYAYILYQLVLLEMLCHHVIQDKIIGLEGDFTTLWLQHLILTLGMVRSLMAPLDHGKKNQKARRQPNMMGQTMDIVGNAHSEASNPKLKQCNNEVIWSYLFS